MVDRTSSLVSHLSLRSKRFRASLSTFFFFCSRFNFRAITRLETLATQTTRHELVNRSKCLSGFQYLFSWRSARLDMFTAWTNIKLLKSRLQFGPGTSLKHSKSFWRHVKAENHHSETSPHALDCRGLRELSILINNWRFMGRSRTGPTDYKRVYTWVTHFHILGAQDNVFLTLRVIHELKMYCDVKISKARVWYV